MGTVISNLTRLNDLEGTLTSVSIGGGGGAAANTDIFLQGSQSLGRRLSNVTLRGFLINDGTTNDLSADNQHLGMWFWATHYASLTALRIRIATATATNYDEHTVPLTLIPSTGGWVKIWVDISRTPDFVGGTALNEAQVQHVGPVVSLPTVGGNVSNIIIDAIDFTTTGLSIEGTNSLFTDFTTADANTTNKYGVITLQSGIFYCYARLTIGTSNSVSFTDSNFVLIFVDQSLVSSNFMGLSINLSNASTVVNLSNSVIKSAGNTRGDIIVSNTSGSFDMSSMTISNLRVITLTSSVEIRDSSIDSSGLITQSGAIISNSTISNSTNSVALLSNNLANISNCTFISSGTGHAIEINTTGTYTFAGNKFSGYGANNTTNAAIYNNSGGLVTINVTSGGDSPTIRNGAGATTVVNANVQITITGLVNPSEVRVYLAGTGTEIAGQENVTTGSFIFSIAASQQVDISILALSYLNLRIKNYSTTVDTNLPVQQIIDRQYLNP